MKVSSLFALAVAVIGTSGVQAARLGEAGATQSTGRALLSARQNQHELGANSERELNIFKDAGKWLKKNVADPIVDYYTWGKKDSSSNLKEASKMMYLSAQAYYSSGRDGSGYKYYGTAKKDNVRAHLWQSTSDSKACAISFAGSDDITDYMTDLEIVFASTTKTINGYKVNKQIYNYYSMVKSDLSTLKTNAGCTSVIATGHSIGGSAALIAQADGLADRSIVFGALRTFKSGCDSTFRNNARRYFLARTDYIVPLNLITSAVPNGSFDPAGSLPSGFSNCAGTNVLLVYNSVSVIADWYNSEVVTENDPTTGGNFAAHLASYYKTALEHLD